MKKIGFFPPIAIATAVIIISIAGVKLIEKTSFSSGQESQIITETNPNNSTSNTANTSSTSIQSRISYGDRVLVNKEESGSENEAFQAAKKRGVEEMAAGNYEKATIEFEAAIQKYRNAPETLIYLNNARIGTNKKYTIAVAVPIGSDLNGALEILRGVAQSQNEVNQAGGINGVPLRVVIANDDDEPQMAKQIGASLVKDSEVLGVVGHFSSGATLAAGEEYDAGKLVAISPVSTAVKLSDFSRYVFRTVPNDAIAAKALANYMLTRWKKKKAAVFFNSKSTYSKSLKSKFVEEVFANGGQVEKELEFDLSDSSFSARNSVKKALEKGTQVLMLAANTGTLDKALLVIQANQKQLSLLGGDDVYAPKILADGGEAAVGMLVAVAWHIDGNPGSDFPRRSEQLWQSRVSWRTATSYDAAQALIAALQRNPSRPGVQQALSTSDFSAAGASGTVQFLSSGDRNAPVQLVEIRPGKISRTGYDFVPIR
ncbi:MAG: ABC transporter substrate-binding protein [Coleofasciculaceae cyanobacterium]